MLKGMLGSKIIVTVIKFFVFFMIIDFIISGTFWILMFFLDLGDLNAEADTAVLEAMVDIASDEEIGIPFLKPLTDIWGKVILKGSIDAKDHITKQFSIDDLLKNVFKTIYIGLLSGLLAKPLVAFPEYFFKNKLAIFLGKLSAQISVSISLTLICSVFLVKWLYSALSKSSYYFMHIIIIIICVGVCLLAKAKLKTISKHIFLPLLRLGIMIIMIPLILMDITANHSIGFAGTMGIAGIVAGYIFFMFVEKTLLKEN